MTKHVDRNLPDGPVILLYQLYHQCAVQGSQQPQTSCTDHAPKLPARYGSWVNQKGSPVVQQNEARQCGVGPRGISDCAAE